MAQPPTASSTTTAASDFLSDLDLLLAILPARIREALSQQDPATLIEIVMDLGRVAEARFAGGKIEPLCPDALVTAEDIEDVTSKTGYFTSDNRAGIPKTLHRISAIRNRQGDIIGLTCRVGKVVTGTIDCIRDLIESGKSVLILGRPGVGKTTRLRETAKLLADEALKRVVIVDTSNEIAGDGDIPHPAVGRARRMQVSTPARQKEVMIEAVENHTPEVIIVDEIGTDEEAQAARTIAERGVILIATAHGSSLESLIKNPMLSDLIGGIQAVTLGDDEAKRRASQKTVLERAKKPTFDICVEIRDQQTLAIYPDVAEAVDNLLRGWTLFPEVRKVDTQTGDVKILQTDVKVLPSLDMESTQEETQRREQAFIKAYWSQASDSSAKESAPETTNVKLFLYSINKNLVERILERLSLNDVTLTTHLVDADAIIALRGSARPGSKVVQLAQDYEIPIYFAKTNTMPQIQRVLRDALKHEGHSFPEAMSELPMGALTDEAGDEVTAAMTEAQEGIDKALAENVKVELTPRRSYIRRLQHELIERHALLSFSVGDEPNRRLRIVPPSLRDQA